MRTPTAFVGKVGKDIFGLKLKATLEEVGINTSNLIVDENARTTLAFVQTFEDGTGIFLFPQSRCRYDAYGG